MPRRGKGWWRTNREANRPRSPASIVMTVPNRCGQLLAAQRMPELHDHVRVFRGESKAEGDSLGLLSLMRRHHHNLRPEQTEKLAAYLGAHPALESIYRFKQRLCYLLLKKHRTRKQCQSLIPRLLRAIYVLRQAGLAPLVQLGQNLHSWSHEIVAMWRFTRNNGITEGFHTKMEVLQRQAYGFRNFQNYRLRVKVMCS